MARWGVSGICALALVSVGCSADVFSCQQDSECQSSGAVGVCSQGHCAFPSDACESGLKFGDGAGSLSGSCVLPGGSTSDGSTSGTSTPATTDPPSTTGLATTSTDGSSSSADGSSVGATGTGSSRPVTFVDEAQEDFEAGTPDGVVIDGGRVNLDPEQGAGAFESRVFDAGAEATWETLSWIPGAPYGKPLPNGSDAETGYSSGGVDMSGNILLMHFDYAAVQGVDAVITDASGSGNDGVVRGAPIPPTAGVFSNAADDSTDSYVSVPITEEGDFQLGTDDFTFAIWFTFTGDCAQNNVFMGADNADGVDDYAHLWLGCSDSHSACPDDGEVRIAGTLTAVHSGDNDVVYCSQSVINDGQWHHALMVKSGHAPTAIRLYLDGVLEYEGGGSFTAPILFPDLPDFVIGGFSRGTYPSSGQFDEAAVWRRALSSEEAAAVHQRGVARLGLQVRTCSAPDCSDAPPFVGGPDLQADLSFEDPADALSPATPASVQGLSGRYLQYRATLSSPGPSVILDRVELVGAVD